MPKAVWGPAEHITGGMSAANKKLDILGLNVMGMIFIPENGDSRTNIRDALEEQGLNPDKNQTPRDTRWFYGKDAETELLLPSSSPNVCH